MWSIEINWNGRWVQVADGFKSRDAAEWATARWKQSHQCHHDPFRTVQGCNHDSSVWCDGCKPSNQPALDPALDFATDAMHGPKDAADPLDCPPATDGSAPNSPMTPEEQEKALAHLDATFEVDRQKVISEVMGMVGDSSASGSDVAEEWKTMAGPTKHEEA